MFRFQHLKKLSPRILFFLVAIAGFLNIPNIGISWDEPGQRLSAGLSVINIANKVAPGLVPAGYSEFSSQADDLINNAPVDHGIAFDAPILLMETVFSIDSTRDIYILHHIVNWIGFLVGLVSIYLLALQIHKRRGIALLAAAMFLLSPRILAEGFYNSKDITFMSFLLLSAYYLSRLWDRRSGIVFALLAGIASGYATDIRILGLVQPPIVAFIFLLLWRSERENLFERLKQFLAYFISYCLTVYLFYPYLWDSPISNLIKVFKSMSKYSWDSHVLYAGERVLAHDLPWHYIPVWIGVTTPVLYLLFFIIGFTYVTWSAISKVLRSEKNVRDLNRIFLLLSLILPLLTVVALHSTLYDGWRHMYFIYPYFLLIAVEGYILIESLLKSRKIYLEIVTSLFLVSVLIWVFANNPRQNLYFNALAGNHIEKTWEMDYWGLSNEYALRYILQADSRQKISVQEVSYTPLEVSAKMLGEREKSRLVFERNQNPNSDYIVNNFRSASTESIPTTFSGYKIFKEFKMDGFTYLEIYKRVG